MSSVLSGSVFARERRQEVNMRLAESAGGDQQIRLGYEVQQQADTMGHPPHQDEDRPRGKAMDHLQVWGKHGQDRQAVVFGRRRYEPHHVATGPRRGGELRFEHY